MHEPDFIYLIDEDKTVYILIKLKFPEYIEKILFFYFAIQQHWIFNKIGSSLYFFLNHCEKYVHALKITRLIYQ